MTYYFVVSEVLFVFVLQTVDRDQCIYSPVRLIKLNQSWNLVRRDVARRTKRTNGSKVYKKQWYSCM